MLDFAEHDLLAQVAAMYYEDEKTQSAIADELGLSRVKVYRLLKQARDERVVEIFVNWPLRRDADLEARLCERFRLAEALVLQTAAHERISTLDRLGQLGARYLEGVLTSGATMAVCLGRSTYAVINAIRPNFRVHVNVAQATGSMPAALGELDSAALARQLANKLGGEVLYLSAPFMAESITDAEILRTQRDIRRTLEAARRADVALLGIGTLDPLTSGFVRGGFLSAEELAELRRAGVVGDMAGHLFTMSGEPHPDALNRRILGLFLEDLRAIPLTLAVAAGQEKTTAILGALHTAALSVLCTDDRTARGVLALEEGH